MDFEFNDLIEESKKNKTEEEEDTFEIDDEAMLDFLNENSDEDDGDFDELIRQAAQEYVGENETDTDADEEEENVENSIFDDDDSDFSFDENIDEENLSSDEPLENETQEIEEIKEDDISEEEKKLKSFLKWSTTNLKNISNYEQDLKLLENDEKIFLLKTIKTNLLSNKVIDNQPLIFLKHIPTDDIDIPRFILKIHKYYLICIALGLVQKKIILEKQITVNYRYVKKEFQKLNEFREFLQEYTRKKMVLQTLMDMDEYLENVEREIGVNKK